MKSAIEHQERLVSALILGLLAVAASSPCASEDPPCNQPPPDSSEPVDGKWKGSYVVSYEIPVVMTRVKEQISGQLDFRLWSEKHVEIFEKPVQCLRVPLGTKPRPECVVDGKPVASFTQQIKVEGPGPRHAEGTATNEGQGLTPSAAGPFVSQSSQSQPLTMSAETEGVWDSVLKALRLDTGSGSQTFGYAQGPAVGTRQFSGPSGRQSQRLRLSIRDCGFMRGMYDTSFLEQALGGAGLAITGNVWSAELEERNLALEQEVDAYVRKPVPTMVSWDDILGLEAEYKKIAGDSSSAYRVCEANKLWPKLEQLVTIGIVNLIADYPTVEQGANVAVLCAANEAVVAAVRHLALMGDQCRADQLFREWVDKALAQQNALAAKLGVAPLSLRCGT